MYTFKYNIVDCFSAATVVTPGTVSLGRMVSYKGIFSLPVVVFKLFTDSHIGDSI